MDQVEQNEERVERMFEQFGLHIGESGSNLVIFDESGEIYVADTFDGAVAWLVEQGDDLVVH